jgi:tellurium resistance protein TerD
MTLVSTQFELLVSWQSRVTAGPEFDVRTAVRFIGEHDDEMEVLDRTCASLPYASRQFNSVNDAFHGCQETVIVDLLRVPEDVVEIRFCAEVYEAQSRGQTFGNMTGAFLRFSRSPGHIIHYANLSEEHAYSTEVGVKLFKQGTGWFIADQDDSRMPVELALPWR